VLALTLLAAAPASASWMIPPSPYVAKDFAFLKHDGLYHLFYIRSNSTEPLDSTQVDFGHAVSPDLWSWSELPPVLSIRPGHFDSDHVWAPSIIRKDGLFYMFYTGVRDDPGLTDLWQRTGLAVSADLMSWTQLEQPVFDCHATPWATCDSTLAGGGFRDPFVMPDPAVPGGYLMYEVAGPASDPGSMVVGAARSSGNLTQWTDAGPLWITHRSASWNDLVESPHLFEHDGLWYLFFTTNSGQPLSFATGPNPLGALPSWTYQGRLATMLGINTQSWFASEYLKDGTNEYFAVVAGTRIEVYRIVWGPPGDWRFTLVQPSLFHVTDLDPGPLEATEGKTIEIAIEAVNPSGNLVELDLMRIEPDGDEVVADAAALGFPTAVAVWSPTTHIAWSSMRAPEDGHGPSRYRVRLRNRTAESEIFEVAPESGPVGPIPPDVAGDVLPPIQRLPRIRGYAANPLGGGNATVQVDLAEAAEVRVDVHDLQGRRIQTLTDGPLSRGTTVLRWDGRTADGARAAAGVYFARLVTRATVSTTRILLRP
jgi:hypothetical protein